MNYVDKHHANFVDEMKYKTVRAVDSFRVAAEEKISNAPTNVRKYFQGIVDEEESNHFGAGLASGAVFGFLL